MANDFSKEERVAFEDILLGFEDALVLSRNVNFYKTDPITMERARNTIWRPQPYIAQSFDGPDLTGKFYDSTQLSVPASIDTEKGVPWTMSVDELRDGLQEKSLGKAAYQRLASDINVAIMDTAVNMGSLVVPVATAATGFDDIALAEAVMNEIGVPQFERYAAIATRDYNNMASNLADRGTVQGKVLTAYEKARIGMLASFDSFKLDYANRLTAAAGVTVTINGANQYYTPVGYDSTNKTNVDNRYQTITIAVTSGTVAAGDAFVIAGVDACHLITKKDTGQLKTFRIVEILTGSGGSGTVKITPPIISNGGSTDAEAMYQNVTATPADGAAITFLNVADAYANPFWQKDALEIIPGTFPVPADAGAAVMKGTTDQGIEVTMQKQYAIQPAMLYFRLDVRFGVACKNTEMVGILLFGQT
jgi:hypothetical protein